MPTLHEISDFSPARKRRRDAFERSVAVIRAFRNSATTEEMERIASCLEQALLPVKVPAEQEKLAAALTQGRTYSEKERLELETANIARYFKFRQDLLKDSLSAPQAANLLGTSRQTPHDRALKGTLLAVRERGGLRFPKWQFDPDGPDGVIPGFSNVTRALDISVLEKISWFVRANPYLEGRTPLEALKAGDEERVVSIARGVGVI